MKHLRHILIGILLLLTSCIENSIPYPVVTLQILGVEGEGFTCAPEDINTQERIVTLHLDEQTDISNVKIDKISVTENARSSKPLSGTFDLRTPLYITLSFYQDYEWTIVADQKIERYFEVESQIGAAEIDVDQLTAKAYVPEGTDLSDLKVTRLKLGPADITTMTPPIDELTSFESVRYVYVAYHDFEEKWSLYVEATDTKVRFTQVDAWSGVIWAYAEGNSADELGFRYRKLLTYGEYIYNNISRYIYGANNQKTDLKNAVFNGWYATASYMILGENRQYSPDEAEFGPMKMRRKGGNLEVAARISNINMNDFHDPAAYITGGKATSYSASLNWYPVRNVVIGLNYIYMNNDKYADSKGQITKGGKPLSEVMPSGIDFNVFQLRTMISF